MKETNKYKKELEKLDNYRLQMNGLCQKWLPREIMKNEETYIDHGYDLYNHISYSLFEELVDKATPMKVDLSTKRLEDYTGEDYYYQRYYDCPKCKNEIGHGIEYCFYCGQKLDWSENEN
ncbi:MAG: helix-turn-helix protein [Podoviridae sp. ctcf755]|nr:MAG: helix-turn-helix protein [Podoviridae sp. ctcf755]